MLQVSLGHCVPEVSRLQQPREAELSLGALGPGRWSWVSLRFLRFADVGLDLFGISTNVPRRESPVFPGMAQGSTQPGKEVLTAIF